MNCLIAFKHFNNFQLILSVSTIMYFLSLAGEKPKQQTDSVRSHSDECICLIVYGKFLRHIEKLIGLEQNVLTLKNSISKDQGNEYCEREESVT